MTGQDQRADLGELRQDLGATVEELAHRADVPARARAKKDETVHLVRERVDQARAWATENPIPVAAAATAVAVLLVRRLRHRSRPS